MKVVKINPKSWTRGTYCSENGKCCAIGFIAKAELKREGVKNPSRDEITKRASNIHCSFELVNTRIPQINDDYSGQKRRDALRKAFRQVGYRLIFEN